jgi:hypothetical protein
VTALTGREQFQQRAQGVEAHMPISLILLSALAVGLLASLAAIYRAYRSDIRKARARVSSGSSVIRTERGPIEYASIGDGVPLLVVHGAGGGFDQTLSFARDLVLNCADTFMY